MACLPATIPSPRLPPTQLWFLPTLLLAAVEGALLAVAGVLAASVSLCIDHRQMSELSAQLILPNQSSLNLNLQTASLGGSCLISGRLFTVSLPVSRLQTFSGLGGDWTVVVRDNDRVSSTPMGYLVGWSMQAEGLR
jgi:subtilisin-like proprotein convertase family protein